MSALHRSTVKACPQNLQARICVPALMSRLMYREKLAQFSVNTWSLLPGGDTGSLAAAGTADGATS